MTPSIDSIPTAYSTDSAGMHPSHSLPQKIRAIADAHFTLLELGFPDLEAYAQQIYPDYKKLDQGGKGDVGKLLEVARKVRQLSEEAGLKVFVVHPFGQFEGYVHPEYLSRKIARAHTWFKVLKALNCQVLQVGSSNDPSSSSNYDTIAADLRLLADKAAKENPPIQIAYEMWAWGSHVNTWEHTWDICQRVSRPNFGLCLDTFQIAARAYADPSTPTGLLASIPAREHLAQSLAHLTAELTPHADKIIYFQISDGAHVRAGNKLFSPKKLVAEAKEQETSPLEIWSNGWRPLPFMDDLSTSRKDGEEEGKFGGYLPVLEVCEAVLKTGWRGVWSYEVFYSPDMAREDPSVPERWARGGAESHQRLLDALKKRGFN